MQTFEGLEEELKKLIIEALVLEDLEPSDIDPEQALFVDGLGLDSIDALEIAVELESRYGVVVGEDPDLNRERFSCVRSLARFVAEVRTR
ncbi:MAG TPA: phosphopantetheine-binding protein [Myxococcota bacterium]|jgi:acyl carrier protein|nr:phosphopantetheine-binding protein [Myxococcota bacterium]